MLVPGEDVCENELSCPSLGHVHAVEDLECVGLKADLVCSTLTVSQILLLLLHHQVPYFFFLLLFKPPYFQKARFFTRSSLWGEVAPLGASR